MARFNIFGRLRLTISENYLHRGINGDWRSLTERSTPIPEKMTDAGENAWDIGGKGE